MMRRVFLALLTALLLISCTAGETPCERTFFEMDTVMRVVLYTDGETGEALLDECEAAVARLDTVLSRTNTGSDVARINRAAADEPVAIHADTAAILALAAQVREASRGAFDIAVEPLGALWRTCEAENRLPLVEEINLSLENVRKIDLSFEGGSAYKRADGGAIDLGGIGKGYAMDAVLSLLRGHGVGGALITFGSNVAALGSKPDGSAFRVAIRDPDGSGTIGTLTMDDAAGVLSVSGHYERYYTVGDTRYSHILDPRTGMPPDNALQSVAVLCDNGALADALSTALLVLGENAGLSLWREGSFDFEAIFIRADGVTLTEGAYDIFSAHAEAGEVTCAYEETGNAP